MRQADRPVFHPVLAIVIAAMLVIGSLQSAVAQATPTASDSSGPGVGDVVVLFDNQGNETAHIAVTDLVDPDESVTRVDRGFHWISIQIVVENVSDRPFSYNSFGPAVIDAEGFATNPSFVSRANEDEDVRPAFPTGEVPAGETASGWAFFQVFNSTVPTLITYTDVSDQFTVLAILGETAFESGAPVAIYDTNARELGTVTVGEIITGFEDADPSVVPSRGMTSVAANITIENTSSRELDANSYAISLIDDLGFRYRPAYVNRDNAGEEAYPDFPSNSVAAGETASGFVLFEIPKAASVIYLIYQPDYLLLYVIAQPGDGSITTGSTLEPAAPPTQVPPSADCIGIVEWADSARENVTAINNLSFINEPNLVDVAPADLREGAAMLRSAAVAQEELEAPVAAEGLNDAILVFLNFYADAFDEAADRIDAGEDPAEVDADLEARSEFNDVFSALFDEASALESVCPDANLDNLFG